MCIRDSTDTNGEYFEMMMARFKSGTLTLQDSLNPCRYDLNQDSFVVTDHKNFIYDVSICLVSFILGGLHSNPYYIAGIAVTL